MTVRPIHLLGSPVLRQRAAEVTAADDDVRALVEDLLDTMRADKGIGLAANQVGIACRVAVVDANDGLPPLALINPVMVERAGSVNGVLFIDHLSPLKRRLLLNKWRRLRKGKEGFLKEVPAAAVEARSFGEERAED
ncbi:MAG: peptide deformylase [Gemmatimonadetes bacterium]|nr:peptide deformylase [Gemmatimonadota bacterium]